MNKLKEIVLLLSLCLLGSVASFAQKDSLALYVQSVITGSDSAKEYAIQKLVEAKNPLTFPMLGAINEKKLFTLDGQIVTIGDKTEEGGTDFYTITVLYPQIKLLEGKKKLTDLKEVEVGRSIRLLLAPISPYLNLVSPEPEKRKMAYGQFQNEESLDKIKIIKAALATEVLSDVKKVGQETLYYLELISAKSDKEAKLVIDSIYDNWGANATTILQDFIDSSSPLTEAKAYAKEKEASLTRMHEMLGVVQNLFSGLSLGSILILIALGLAIVYGLAGIINMAHGEFLMIGAYTTYCVQVLFVDMLGSKSDAFFWCSLPASFIMAGIWGYAMERLIIRFLYSRPLESMLATWGASLVMVQIARSIFGDLTAVKTPVMLSGGLSLIPHLVLPYNRLFIIGFTGVMISLTYFMLYKSKLGLRIRAVTQNRNMSSCLGIETRKVDTITFFLGSGLAGIAGCAMTLIGNVVPDMGQTYIVDSFLVVVTGGVGKLAGTIVSGFTIGFLSKILESFYEAVYGKVMILGLIIIFLQFKPKGLFPDKGRIGDD
jgi:urea transport system permease protein